jgi:hypothetical protein
MTDTFEETAQEQRDDRDFVEEFAHEDGSLTFVMIDTDPEHADPREDEGLVSTLIREGRDYTPLDDDDEGLAEARDRWDWLGTYGYSSRGQRGGPHFVPTAADKALFAHYDRDKIMQRYVAMFRPDILHYCDRWEASGFSQGHYTYGWGYVSRAKWEYAMGEGYTGPITPEEAFGQEVNIYELYFRGEVYGYVHIEPDGEVVTTDVDGEHAECRHCGRDIEPDKDGRWIDPEATGDDVVWRETCDENHDDRIAAHEPTRTLAVHEFYDGKGRVTGTDGGVNSCWGFLGYKSLKEVAEQATASPVVG